MNQELRGFYEYHATILEPWDGPAAICFTNGRQVGATLDRNGLRPCRYVVTKDDRMILASEAGVFPIAASQIRKRGRLEPGKMILVDTALWRIIEDEEIKSTVALAKPYRAWVGANLVPLDALPATELSPRPSPQSLLAQQRLFGYTEEELSRVLVPMAEKGEEPVSSMGDDTPLAVLSERPQLLFRYFKQHFAQVTNPPIDPIREELVMSAVTYVGLKSHLFEDSPGACRRLRLDLPILTNRETEKIRRFSDPDFRSRALEMFFEESDPAGALERSLLSLCGQAERAIEEGHRILILSDRGARRGRIPIPSLLAASAVHQHLIRRGLRGRAALLVETGEARDVHHMACLIGFGAEAVNPYLVFETARELVARALLPGGSDNVTAETNLLRAYKKGLFKILSKMGISTVQSYHGAQIFEALGLDRALVDRHFTGTSSRFGGIDLRGLEAECRKRHEAAFSAELAGSGLLEAGGEIHYRSQGEDHGWNPTTIAALAHASSRNDRIAYERFSNAVHSTERAPRALKDCLELRFDPAMAIPLASVEPAAEIVRRFNTGAMSLGALSTEAHESLAIAMNRIGGKSNSGEGGEDPRRFKPLANGDSQTSAIKQIASARFGVTIQYLVNARELQIKMAQGAKPGEGGQLPAHKVDATIARLRHSTPGVQLISPPPHHDIYSIEDLAQLIYDLKQANPSAKVSVKLVAETGVGTIAAGVVKAGADKVLISGDSGGTGASPLSSIRYAGLPWELGIAEAHQTLVLNGLRGRALLETDGQLRTGRDVVVAAILGAEEFGFATAPLITQGCVMTRKCHLNTCPVGVATQDPVLRQKFSGKPEHLIRYLFFVAEEARALLSALGARSLEELIGRVELLVPRRLDWHSKAKNLDLSPLLYRPRAPEGSLTRRSSKSAPAPLAKLDQTMLTLCAPALEEQKPVKLKLAIRNTDRAAGTRLSSEITRRHGARGLSPGLIQIELTGSAGQSFGAFLCRGVTLSLKGEANDGVGKGLSGGRLAIKPEFDEESILIGNTALYGATSGEVFIAGSAGERFAVRNSGATAVVEGVGDHGCEYMTGGVVVVLGPTGRNFAAGMSGGVAYVWNANGAFEQRCNRALVDIEPVVEAQDRRLLLKLLHEHLEATGSKKARGLLARWPEDLPRFRKVISPEYKRARASKGGSHERPKGISEIRASP